MLAKGHALKSKLGELGTQLRGEGSSLVRGWQRALKLIYSHLPAVQSIQPWGTSLLGFSAYCTWTLPGEARGRRARGGGVLALSLVCEACPSPSIASASPPHQPGRAEPRPGPGRTCCLLQPLATASGGQAAVFSHRRATTWAVHPGGCQQEGWAASTGFSHSSSLEPGGARGIDKAGRLASCPLQGPPGRPCCLSPVSA